MRAIHDDHDRRDPSIDFENRCIECGDEALNRCQSCGRPLCGRHNETGGGFCQDFTTVETELGRVPACIRAIGEETFVDSNAALLHGQEDLPAPEEVTREDLEAAVREQLPEAVFEAAADRLVDAINETSDNQIVGGAWSLHRELKRIVDGERPPDNLDAIVDAIDGLLERVEQSADESSDVEIANDFSIGMELGFARDEIERVRGTALVEEIDDVDDEIGDTEIVPREELEQTGDIEGVPVYACPRCEYQYITEHTDCPECGWAGMCQEGWDE